MTTIPLPASMGLEFQNAIADFPITLADRIKSRARRRCTIAIAAPRGPECQPAKKRKIDNVVLTVDKPKVELAPMPPPEIEKQVMKSPVSMLNIQLLPAPLAEAKVEAEERVVLASDNKPSMSLTPERLATPETLAEPGTPVGCSLVSKPNVPLAEPEEQVALSTDVMTTITAPRPVEASEFWSTCDLRPIDEDVICVATKAANGIPERVILPKTDLEYVAAMQEVLARWSAAKTSDAQRRSSRRIQKLLDRATPPQSSEAYFASAVEAERLVLPDSFVNCPIFTKQQQPTALQTVNQFLSEFYDDDALVDVQDPSMPVAPHTRRIAIGKVKDRFRSERPSNKPWNLLEMATHVDEGIRPAFLNGEDCRLLTKLKIPLGEKNLGARRPYDTGYKEMERWALLAQAGALTEPHQDSHGYSTFITCNQGEIGFGWLSNPTDAERVAWRASPFTFTEGRWRYVVLRAGDTVYFPAGTVHFVFRLPAVGNTLAFGGHVLRCSNIVHWAKTLLEEKQSSNITNEELSSCALGSLERVETFVRQASKKGQEGKWGGKGSIEEFLKLKQRFVAM